MRGKQSIIGGILFLTLAQASAWAGTFVEIASGPALTVVHNPVGATGATIQSCVKGLLSSKLQALASVHGSAEIDALAKAPLNFKTRHRLVMFRHEVKQDGQAQLGTIGQYAFTNIYPRYKALPLDDQGFKDLICGTLPNPFLSSTEKEDDENLYFNVTKIYQPSANERVCYNQFHVFADHFTFQATLNPESFDRRVDFQMSANVTFREIFASRRDQGTQAETVRGLYCEFDQRTKDDMKKQIAVTTGGLISDNAYRASDLKRFFMYYDQRPHTIDFNGADTGRHLDGIYSNLWTLADGLSMRFNFTVYNGQWRALLFPDLTTDRMPQRQVAIEAFHAHEENTLKNRIIRVVERHFNQQNVEAQVVGIDDALDVSRMPISVTPELHVQSPRD